MVLFALVVLGELAALGFASALQENRAGRNAVELEYAAQASESGIQLELASWAARTYESLRVGDSVPITMTDLPDGSGTYHGSVVRLNSELFLVRVLGVSSEGSATQETAQILRLNRLNVAEKRVSRLRERGWLMVW